MAADALDTRTRASGSSWWLAGPVLVLGLAVLGWMFYPTFASIVDVWNRSDTFAHGFLIVPIVLFLLFLKRQEVLALEPQPSWWALVPLAGFSLVWVAGELVDVVSVRQFAAVLMIPALFWLVLGNAITWRLQFPLAYLLFAVPFGEFLVPPLMDFTADFTVAAVQLTGIPVYRDGLYFDLPTSRWSVIEACSGVRYLIASVALGTLYAYLMYRSTWRRLVFVGVSIVVPIVANGLRAYMIVMIGHLSDMEYAAGVDHLIYGWIFFGVVIALMFGIGAFWREDMDAPGAPVRSVAPGRSPHAGSFAVAAVLAVVLASAAPLYAEWMNQRDLGPVAGLGAGPLTPPGWRALEDQSNAWEPGYRGARDGRGGLVVAEEGGPPVGMHVLFYRKQHQYGTMVGWSNTLAGRHRAGVWSQSHRGRTAVDGYPDPDRFLLNGPGQQLLVWRWYWAGGQLTTLPHTVKAREALNRLVGGRDDAALVVFYAPYDLESDEVEAALQAYAADALPGILERLATVTRQ
ncbi:MULTISPECIES: exosortase A [unclassified Thioalkalivibrio]|uniref:exosortase A n=1 Tax=unclassified Thioalkalivibrio TaxID=2621013 RepID=UPI00037D8453|nr:MULTISPECIES: exosortase A [unclassified Thioalkalivibrio]